MATSRASHWEVRVPGDIFVPTPLHPLAVGIVQSTLELLEHKLTSLKHRSCPAFLGLWDEGKHQVLAPSSFLRVERICEGFQNPSANVRKRCLEFIFGDEISIVREDWREDWFPLQVQVIFHWSHDFIVWICMTQYLLSRPRNLLPLSVSMTGA